ncbi:phage tail protein [Proteus vulgaris]|uniref:phage tail-collar fiber domain-containing protein n=1 Tax=Proteus vulgaris TaxID=585 RepID=UPI002361EFE8|nr:phage tail protein [Proteus vulgaris]
MSAKFFALLTVIGANKLAKATALGTTLKITQMAVGDGGGTLPMPSAEQTKLVNEKRRAGINTLFIDPKNTNQIVAEQVIPENEGGYWIREIGLFDDEGSLIAVGNCPETYKPQLQEGSGRTQTIRMILIVSHAESVELKVDPSVVLATREFVDNAIETASKSILDTVKKEYATKEDVKKKFDSSNVVHEKGASREKVISQKGVTELFQPKGSYPTNTELSAELNKKIDKANISQQLANDVNKVPSLDLLTKELGKKQASGNYADKSKTAIQLFSGGVRAPYVDAIQGELYVGLRAFNETPSLYISNKGIGYNIYIPSVSGTLALESYGYSKTESDNKYQPKGNYADKSLSNDQIFTGSVSSQLNISSSSTNSTLALDTTKTYPRLSHRVASGSWREIKIPDRSGEMSLVGDSYTKAESDGRYQSKGDYADKSTTTTQRFFAPIEVAGEAQSSTGDVRLGIKTASNKPTIVVKHGSTSEWRVIDVPNKSGTIALISDIDEANNIPVGSPIPWSLGTAPSGYLICNGQTFNKSTYPKLAIAYPAGRLPDLRGEFIRGIDGGRGVDSGRQMLSAQVGNSLLSSNIFGGLSSSESNKWHKTINYIGISGTDNDGGYGVYQQIEGANGNETRPRNIAFLYIVRAA